MIPPGWRLFHATGADKVTGTWIDRWSLLKLLPAAGDHAGGAAPVRLAAGAARVRRDRSLDHRVGRARRGLAGGAAGRGAGARAARGQAAHGGARVPNRRVDRARVGSFPVRGRGGAAGRASGRRARSGAESEQQRVGCISGLDGAAPATRARGGAGRGIGGETRARRRRRRLREDIRQPRRSVSRPKEQSKAEGIARRQASSRWLAEQQDKKLRSDAVSQNRDVYDPTAVVQTGPGLPTWNWDPPR